MESLKSDKRNPISKMLEQLLFAQELWFIHHLKIQQKLGRCEFLITQKAKPTLEKLVGHIFENYPVCDIDQRLVNTSLPFEDQVFFHVEIKWFPGSEEGLNA